MSWLRTLYLSLSVLGAALTLPHFVAYLWMNGWDWRDMIAAWFQNSSVRGVTFDVLVAAVTASIWIVADTTLRRAPRGLWALPVIWGVGLGCGLPLYLYIRSRPLA
ncbi:DUF2834 domain-containing protein [Phaeovulum vinaykumarii]|uniref:DUF2834 domain-containing protein n=1 Tax=Phaeovulum vinaykumarii TaxID=407234 RepID=A0A1N7KQV9_9RHOB|nr:DUF2834 domain-containing protein [Phaeovulum vinaykumarii]SIS63886.1 Protein of unknown function [Phaeovulum vinaykumarii]SOC01746.1 uncharacterized protein DUF2834 [Phaeovulum vinaykumarii]